MTQTLGFHNGSLRTQGGSVQRHLYATPLCGKLFSIGLVQGRFDLNNFLCVVKCIGAVKVYFGQTFFIYGKCRTLFGTVFVDAA